MDEELLYYRPIAHFLDASFFASKVASIINENPYESVRTALLKRWENYDPFNMKGYYFRKEKKEKETETENAEKSKVKMDERPIVFQEKILETLEAKYNLPIQEEIRACGSKRSIEALACAKDNIVKKIKETVTDASDQQRLIQVASSLANTSYGTENESAVYKLYKEKTNIAFYKQEVVRRAPRRCIYLSDRDDLQSIHLCGYADGVNVENGLLLEIKNRRKRLFHRVPEYEKIQVMCLLYINQLTKCHFVECVRGNETDNYKVHFIDYDEEYMQNIIAKLVRFHLFFSRFCQNDDIIDEVLARPENDDLQDIIDRVCLEDTFIDDEDEEEEDEEDEEEVVEEDEDDVEEDKE